jgi:hypothetical protein
MRRCTKKNFVELWDPNTATCFNFDRDAGSGSGGMNQRANDPQCPMKKIWCVAGEDNVWANIQAEVAPVLINYDLDNKNHWEPFFNASVGSSSGRTDSTGQAERKMM